MCWMIGDRLDDVDAGPHAGCGGLPVDTGGETEGNAGLGLPDAVFTALLQGANCVPANGQCS